MGFAQVDRQLRVLSWGGEPALFDQPPRQGSPITDALPELIGAEAQLQGIARGEEAPLHYALINRESPQGELSYVDLMALPSELYQGGLSIFLQERSEAGRTEQRWMQELNETRLALELRQRQSRDLQVQNAELERLADVRAAFVSTAAHELRSPLTAIMAYLELLLEDDPGRLAPDQRDSLLVVQSSAERLAGIIHNLLDMSYLESGQLEAVLQPADFGRLLAETLRELTPRIRERSLRLGLNLPQQLPPALLDRARAAQILHNLLDNAIKYTPPGGEVTVSVDLLAPTSGHDDQLRFTVRDTGVGIPAADQHRLFERFFRASTATRTEARGSGLGLYITRALVELHGGEMGFESREGEGSAFWATFGVATEGAV